MERTVIHLNIADFSVAVERLLDTGLRRKALIIAEPSPRAVVHDMSDEAYGEGVRKGMLLAVARRRCRAGPRHSCSRALRSAWPLLRILRL